MKLFSKLISQLLIVSMMMMPFSAQAGMIGTDQAVASAEDRASRDKVLDFVSRTDVIKQLEALGITAANAQERVGAMTQAEINSIAGKMDSLPAGAGAGVAIAVIVIVGLLAYFFWYRKR